jgi:hypothetical protein
MKTDYGRLMALREMARVAKQNASPLPSGKAKELADLEKRDGANELQFKEQEEIAELKDRLRTVNGLLANMGAGAQSSVASARPTTTTRAPRHAVERLD